MANDESCHVKKTGAGSRKWSFLIIGSGGAASSDVGSSAVKLVRKEDDSRSTASSTATKTSLEAPELLEKVSCHLESSELWSKFHQLGTEMIITKTGRYVFW